MATKLQFYSAVAERAAKDATAKRGNWTNFLDTAARLYKYSFPDQLMIHAQRPGATACAPIETWNDSFNHWVRRGSKGIALIDDTGSYPRLKYVFDVADTEASLYNSRPVKLWEMRQEHKAPVLDALAKVYDDVDDSLADTFHNIARQMAREYYEDNAREIRYRAENSFLEEFDDLNLSVAFENALSVSIAYTLMSRCGFDTDEYFEDEDFQCIFDFNTPDMVYALGTATSELSEQVLRDVEIVIKKYERQHAAERSVTNERTTDIHASRGLSAARSDTGRTAEGADGTVGTVRADAEIVSERTPDNNVQLHAPVGEAVPASERYGGSGEQPAHTSDERTDSTEQSARQGERSARLDGGDERTESPSGGNGIERTDLRIEEPATGAAENAAPFSMAELAQYHSDWNKYIINGIINDDAVLNAAINSDKENTVIEIGNSLKRLQGALHRRILDSTEIRKGVLWNELDSYFTKDRKPPLEQQLYDTVIRSAEYKARLAENNTLSDPPPASREPNTPVTDGVPPVSERYSQLGNTFLTDTLSTSSITLDEVDAILRDGGNDKNSVLRIAAHFAKGLSPEENADFLRREYLLGRWGRSVKEGRGKGFQFGAEPTSVWSDETGMTIGRGKSALAARDFAHITWEQAAARVGQLYYAGQYVSHDVLDEALYNESAERANDFIEVYGNIQRGLSDVQYELRNAMDKAQKEATKDDWKHRRYLIAGLTELSDRADKLLNGENEASPDEIMQLYNETLSISEEIPEEWNFGSGHPDVVKRITELLRDKGELSESEIIRGVGYSDLSEFGIILRRLKEDIAELEKEPDAPIRFYHNPHRLLSNLEKSGLPPKGFPVAEIPTLSFMRFITEDEVDSYLTRGGTYSEGKFRILSHFLQEHTPKERADFLKNEYGHGGGTWSEAGDGWHDAEPGKGISLKRGNLSTPYSEVKLTWSAAATRIGKLVQDGRYMTRAELDRIPNYEKLMLMRSVSNFYYDLPAEYERPFVEKGSFSFLSKLNGEDRDAMDFHNPREVEWTFIHSFLSDEERIDAVLGVMQYVYVNTPEEDRYYNLRKAGFENLSAYREGTYTLFPGLDQRAAGPNIRTAGTGEYLSSRPQATLRVEALDQMTLFGADVFPVLPSVHEQQTIIEQAAEPTPEPTAVVDTSAVSLSNELDTVDALLLNISDADKVRLAAQISDNPRSRETVALVREIYGDTLPIPLPQAIKRITELVADGQFTVAERNEKAPDIDTDWLDYILVGELVANTLKDRVYKYFTEENPSVPEATEFLKDAYGKMFASGGLDGIGIRNFESKEDGITANLTDGGTRFADWTAIANRVRSLIDSGEYLKIPDELIEGRNAALETNADKLAAPEPETTDLTSMTPFTTEEKTESETDNKVWYSPGLKIPYHEGAFIDALAAGSIDVKIVIDKISNDYVYYNFVDEPNESSAEMFRDRFEDYLDSGDWKINASKNEGQAITDKAPVEPEPPAAIEAASNTEPPTPVEVDFDTVAETVLQRVMADADYAEALSNAQSRASLRNPCTWALEQSIRDHEKDEPEVYSRYFSDDVFNDNIFDYVLKQSWANRPAPESAVTVPSVSSTTAEPPAQPPPADIPVTAEAPDTETPAQSIPLSPDCPPPVFFLDWKQAQHDFELNLYRDHDVIGYDRSGVEHVLGRSGTLTYVTQTGAFMGSNAVPGNIYEQIQAYESGEVTAEQLRENYLKVLRDFAGYRAANLSEANGDLVDVLSNGLFSLEGKKNILWRLETNATNYELAVHLSESCQIAPETITMISGETADYYSTASGVFIHIQDDLNTKLSFSWADIVPVLRTRAQQWQTDLTASIVPETPAQTLYDGFTEITDPAEIAEIDAIFGGNKEPEPLKSYVAGSRIVLDLNGIISRVLNPNAQNLAGEFHVDIVKEDNITVRMDTFSTILTFAEAKRYEIQPIAEQVYREPDAAYYLMRYPNGVDAGAAFGIDELKLITEYSKRYVICAEACYLSEEDMARYNITFRKMPRDWNLLPEAMQAQIRAVKPEYEQQWLDSAQNERGLSTSHSTITLHQVGDFFEVYNGDAHILSQIFGYTVREMLGHGEPSQAVSRDVIGFPAFNLDKNLDVLKNEHGYTVNINRATLEKPPAPQIFPDAANFRITDDHLGEGGAKTKYRYNIDAIKTLQAIEREQRAAAPNEQEVLSRYVGWGGLPDAFDAEKPAWVNEYRELQSLLTTEEYESARASTLNAHYTSPTVIRAIYDTVERMGFTTGNILEPACGVGNFFGLLPDSMKNAKMYGVELDSVTARIAKLLYPKANIKETGFERTDTPDAFFDLAIGNVPFGDYGVLDKRYDKHRFKIHDYFFAKTLDQVRPGGVIAFVTSKGTLDKQNPEVRKYIAQRAELLGAVRLPNTAFLKNAGTEVTSDIIFLKKRDRLIDIEPDWVHLGLTDDGIPVNRYYADNPEMILGTMANDDGVRMYGNSNSTTCIPFEGADLAEQLKTALLNVQGEISAPELDDIEGIDNHAIAADSHVKNFSYALITPTTEPDNVDGQFYAAKIGEGQVYFRENSLMYPVDLPATTLERIKGMIALRDCVHRLIALQLDDHGADEIAEQQRELDALYDQFTAQYGLINSTANNRAFCADSAYYLLCSLEMLDEDGNLARKADMFTKRTIKQRNIITHVDTASEALAVSLGERAYVDLDYMAQLTGFSREKLIEDLRGVIFLNIGGAKNQRQTYVTADDYLSGNVREKLDVARAAALAISDGSLDINVAALEAAQPKDLDASEIAVRLGATWIDQEYVQQFMYELLNTNWRNQDIYQVKYHALTGEWQVTGKGKAQYSDIPATVTYGTSRMNAYEIIADTLNLRDVRVYDYKEDVDGKEIRVLNKKETTLAQQKQEQIKQAFKDWIWKDPERRQTLVNLYNERFNSVRPREYDGSHITFSGTSPEITMRPHQLNAIAHILYGGNTLLAHVVGAGKTFEMVGAAMEAKRLGLCHKSLFAVPNHLTEQWAGEFLRLYPSANILVATKKDFELRNRKKFCAKIATGDYDAVIIGHSQMEKIPMSAERQERLLNEQIWEIEAGIEELKAANGERFSIKQLEKTRKSLEIRLKKLLDSKKRDDVVTFEQLGVDRLFVDEAHSFKNLFLVTKMRNVAGLSTSEAQKSSDLFMKCRYMDELTDGKGIIFATGTPISNSMTEMYTMQRYLQYDTLVSKNLTHFDCWASIFGETQTSIELAPEGTGYRARTRFAKFHNLPELMSMFKDVADIQTADMLNLPVPEAKFETVVVKPSDLQKEMVQELSERAAAVHAKLVDPREDNMLKITTDGRKIGLDQRLINPLLPDFEGSKVNACTDNVFRIWEDTKDKRLTQLLFCDFSTPNKDGRFNIYDDIRDKLLARGIPEHEIAFIHDADTETRKKELFTKVRQGKVRVLFGSTFKMGAGTNVQDRLVALHDADCPWRPSDLEQRAGRIVRQGNQNTEVQIYRYVTEATFDAYLYQTLENKQKFISQIMSSKSPVRSCEDVDEQALSYAEIKALCAGNPLIKEKMDLDIEVARLRLLKADYNSQRYRLEDDLLKRFPEQITAVTERIAGIEKDIEVYKVQSEKLVDVQPSLTGGAATVTARFPGMTVSGVEYHEKEPAAKALLESCKGVTDKKEKAIGSYMGFNMSLSFDSFNKVFHLHLRGAMTYQVELGTDTFGNITRINNALSDLPKRLEGAKSQLESLSTQQTAAKAELEKPFVLADELAEKEVRLALLNADLNIDGNGDMDVENDADEREEAEPMSAEEYESEYGQRAAASKSARPSMLEGIRAFNAEKQPPVPGRRSSSELDI